MCRTDGRVEAHELIFPFPRQTVADVGKTTAGVDITDITHFTNTMRVPAPVTFLVCALAGGATAQNPEIVSDGNNVQILAPSGDITVRHAPHTRR